MGPKCAVAERKFETCHTHVLCAQWAQPLPAFHRDKHLFTKIYRKSHTLVPSMMVGYPWGHSIMTGGLGAALARKWAPKERRVEEGALKSEMVDRWVVGSRVLR